MIANYGHWSIAADGCIFADGVFIGSIVPKNRAANGALIVAAPDMYEALVALTSPICSESEDAEAHAKARAALAKAVPK